MKPLLITKSRVATHQDCPRKHLIMYVDGYRPIAVDTRADFGSLMHAGLEAWWIALRDGGKDPIGLALAAMAAYPSSASDEATRAKADLLMMAYHARWEPCASDYKVLEVEREFSTKVPGVNSVRSAGKIDAIVRRLSDGTIWNVEHKTTGADLSPGSTYWQRLRLDHQVSTYTRGSAALGYDVAGTIYDVLVRPDERPLAATPVEKRKYLKDSPTTLYKGQRDADETMDEFKARIANKIMAEPDAYFARQEVVRLDSEMVAFDADVRDLAIEIRNATKTRRAPRNTNACFDRGSICPFYDVCSGAASLDDPYRFTKSTNVHPELSGVTSKPEREGTDKWPQAQPQNQPNPQADSWD